MSHALVAVQPVLMARDVGESTAFFARLGFAVTFVDDPAAPRYAGLMRDGLVLHVQWADAGQWVPGVDRPAVRFVVRDVDALHAAFGDAGALVEPYSSGPWAAPGDTPWGTREFHVRDPGGNVLQFYAPLPGPHP